MDDDIDRQLREEGRRELHAMGQDCLREELNLFRIYLAETSKMIRDMNAAVTCPPSLDRFC